MLFETAPALHRRPSCSSDTSPAPATALLHQRPSSCTSRHQRTLFCTSRYQQLPVLHKQLPVLNQRPLSCTSRHQQLPVLHQHYQSCTSNHLPAPIDISSYQFCTNNYQSRTSDHFPAPANTSPEPATNFLHQQKLVLYQQKPVLHQRPPIQRIPVLYQLSRPAPATRSCSNDHHPAATIVHRTLFRFTIRHNKVWPFEATPLVLSFLPSLLSITYISKVCGDWYIYLASATTQV